MNRIVEILMKRDGLTESEAEDLLDEAREDFYSYPDDEYPFDICNEWFGLEPDYLFDLLGG